ncbi:PAS domain S-box protein [Sphaerospermopsis aphanizomenoides BCCUSP55]|uniref:PAS domain S-box protein n=1 Tax=Sphaerospermopsis aphanizomenoides TaxID=459663 RepID=UPI0019053A35|nr:PAS domain S-box protein [Sphaerospermopsis aphanizomenoides]MBK1986256.1 PAS domain S-box protein [Sphaerospermopsis aphanizomenoides BCCUSP55]
MQFNDHLIDLPSLHQVIDRYPLTISPDSPVVAAISLMMQGKSPSCGLLNHVSASLLYSNQQQKANNYILVLQEGRLLGIFTLIDVLKITALGMDLSKTTMAEVMTQPLITFKQSDLPHLTNVLSLFQKYQTQYLPIIDDQEKLVGIVTESRLLQEMDLVKIVSVVEAVQETLQNISKCPEKNQHLEGGNDKTDNLLKTWVEERIAKEIQIQEKLQETLEELQIVEEEIRKQNEQLAAAREMAELERRRYQDLFEFTPDGYLVTDKLGIIQEANHAASSLLLVHPKYLVGKPITVFIAPSDRHAVISHLRNSQHFQEWEIYLQPREGKPFPASVRLRAVYDRQGQWHGWSWLLSDISDRKQAEIALRQSSDELEKRVAERTKELIVANQALEQEIIERQQIEAALKESEAKFRQFGENLQSHIWIYSQDCSEIVYVNPAYERMWGRSCQSLRENPQSWREAIHPEDRDRILTEIAERHQKGEGTSLEYRIIHPNGEIRWLWARCFPMKNEQDDKFYYGGITEDITERKLAEESLRDSEARLTLALETVNMGIWERNLTTNQCIWSDNMGPLYGLTRGTLCPESHEEFFSLIYPEDRELCIQAVNRAIEENGEFTVEYRVIWSDGSLHWLRGTGKVQQDLQGQPTRIIGTTRDISDRKQKEQTLSEQAALLDIATDAIFVRDFQTEILFWNQGAERIYGWHKHEAVGKNLKDLFCSQHSLQQEATALRTVVKSGTWQGELRKKTKLGREIIVESRWTLMFDADGQPKSILVVDSDITEKKQLEEQFFRTQRLESIGTLAGGIAHDLNNILTPILGAAQLLKGRFAKDEERHPQLLTIIENNAQRGAALVKQVLSFARGLKGERGIVQVRHLISEIVQIGKQTFPKSIEFTTQIPENLWTVSGDTTQLHQVLMNLVVNARDAMPEGGKLKITADNIYIDEAYTRMHLESKVGNYIVITVTDTGMGMTPETLDRIFEPFFTTKEFGSGTGLGLSTALGIVKSHNGFVTVSSHVDKGSKFKVFLPSIESPQIASPDQSKLTLGKGELILVVDDEPQIRDVATIILENHNYQTITASNGMEAIALYAKHKKNISAVLMDMMMPEMDGVTAIRTMQKMNPKVQVIACSGLNTKDVMPESEKMEVQAVLLKPYTAYELLQNLNQIICEKGNRE